MLDEERGYGRLPIQLQPDALDHLVDVANGDARGVLNALELAVETTAPDADGVIIIDLAIAEESIQRRAVLYDKEGDVHYDTISAFIKSLRGSDPDAALYWMASMVYAGEDPRFIFRRMTIFAGEDVGMADPHAIGVVVNCWQAFERIGMPEGRFPLAQAAIYLATAPKSNSAFAFFDALETVQKEQEAEVPNHLKDGNRDKEGFGHGKGYLYPHAYRDHWVAQQYLPDGLQGKVFYQPGDQGYEQQIQMAVARKREAQLAAMLEGTFDAPLEVLTTSPQNRARDVWLQRTIANSGRNLAQQREKLFELAGVQRHHLVLDLNAGSGLLTWEALRQSPEGGVWALTADATAGEALRQQAERLPELERPHILIGALDELDYLLALRGEEDVRFDCIIGRNVFTRDVARLPQILVGLKRVLGENGRFCFIQTIPRHTQRLYRLVDWSGYEALGAKVAAAEEAIYANPADPLVNWDEHDLKAAFKKSGLNAELMIERQVEERRIAAGELARWFGSSSSSDPRPDYAHRLRAGGLVEDELQQVALVYGRQLRDQMISWHSVLSFVVGSLL